MTDEQSIDKDRPTLHLANDGINVHEISTEYILQDHEGEKRMRMNILPPCLYCDVSHPFHKDNLNPLVFKQLSEDYRKRINLQTEAKNDSRMSRANQYMKQQEDKGTQTQESFSDTPLDRIQMEVNNGQEISPFIFSTLWNLVKIRDKNYSQILKILSHSCHLMKKNSPQLIRKFFTSKQFFQQFVNTNMIIDEIWMLRKAYPERLQEWKVMHNQVLFFRSKLLRFLEKEFGRDWTKNLIEMAEEQRVRVWPLTPL